MSERKGYGEWLGLLRMYTRSEWPLGSVQTSRTDVGVSVWPSFGLREQILKHGLLNVSLFVGLDRLSGGYKKIQTYRSRNAFCVKHQCLRFCFSFFPSGGLPGSCRIGPTGNFTRDIVIAEDSRTPVAPWTGSATMCVPSKRPLTDVMRTVTSRDGSCNRI